ncbi:hypothetical protein NPIL_170711 [Nephila pilipes]|uniref:Uncharacterized protein n=1 Tax=Nephila pilipes TaxID=299642 RepID=A0A8X6NAK1_NEPPI|nr:hypothetical protein NPIL_170711 [Nephila pilipes]
MARVGDGKHFQKFQDCLLPTGMHGTGCCSDLLSNLVFFFCCCCWLCSRISRSSNCEGHFRFLMQPDPMEQTVFPAGDIKFQTIKFQSDQVSYRCVQVFFEDHMNENILLSL